MFFVRFFAMAFICYLIDFPKVFRELPDNIPKILREFYCGCTIKYNKTLINQLFVPYGKYLDLSFSYGPHFIRSIYNTAVRTDFAVWTSQLVNKSIVNVKSFYLKTRKLYKTNYIDYILFTLVIYIPFQCFNIDHVIS